MFIIKNNKERLWWNLLVMGFHDSKKKKIGLRSRTLQIKKKKLQKNPVSNSKKDLLRFSSSQVCRYVIAKIIKNIKLVPENCLEVKFLRKLLRKVGKLFQNIKSVFCSSSRKRPFFIHSVNKSFPWRKFCN